MGIEETISREACIGVLCLRASRWFHLGATSHRMQRDVLQLRLGWLLGREDREARNPTDHLQVAANGAGADYLCRATASSHPLSLRDVKELLDERGLASDQTTIWRSSRLQPCGINTAKARLYNLAIAAVKTEGTLRRRFHRPVQDLNNILEQDHRAIRRRVKAKQSFREFRAARRPIAGMSPST